MTIEQLQKEIDFLLTEKARYKKLGQEYPSTFYELDLVAQCLDTAADWFKTKRDHLKRKQGIEVT